MRPRAGLGRVSVLSEEAGGRDENTARWESSIVPLGGPAETLPSHAKGDGGKAAGSGQQLCGWGLEPPEAHRSLRLCLLPSS